MANYRYENINIVVSALNTSTPFSFKTNSRYKKVVGIYIPSNEFIGEFSEPLKINDKEILPVGYSLILLMSSLKVKPDKRFFDFDFEALGQTITGSIRATCNVGEPFPITVQIVLKYEV